MTVFVLDTDVISLLAAHGAGELECAGRLPIVVPELVWDECGRGDQRKASVCTRMLKAIAGGPLAWDPLSPEHQAWLEIPKGLTRKKLGDGERAVTAYAYVHDDAIAVLADQLAMKSAIEHLRGRVLSLFGFLGAMADESLLPSSDLAAFTRRYEATDPGRRHPPPLWWSRYLPT